MPLHMRGPHRVPARPADVNADVHNSMKVGALISQQEGVWDQPEKYIDTLRHLEDCSHSEESSSNTHAPIQHLLA